MFIIRPEYVLQLHRDILSGAKTLKNGLLLTPFAGSESINPWSWISFLESRNFSGSQNWEGMHESLAVATAEVVCFKCSPFKTSWHYRTTRCRPWGNYSVCNFMKNRLVSSWTVEAPAGLNTVDCLVFELRFSSPVMNVNMTVGWKQKVHLSSLRELEVHGDIAHR